MKNLRPLILIISFLGLIQSNKGQQRIGFLYDDSLPIALENCDYLNNSNLTVSSPFNPVEGLEKSIGGKMYFYVTDCDSSYRITWNCPSFKKQKFEGAFVDDTFRFPYDLFNETSWIDTFRFKLTNGDEIIHLFTNTTNSMDFMHVGRFQTGMLGIISFLKTNNGYKLIYKNPGFASLGMFAEIPKIEPIKLGEDNYGFYIVNYFSSPGWGAIGDLHLFGFVNGNVKRLFMESEVYRSGGGPSDELNFIIKTNGNPNDSFLDLSVVISGQASKPGEEGFEYIHDSIKKMLKKEKSFSFTLTSDYTFRVGEYKFLRETFVVEKSKK